MIFERIKKPVAVLLLIVLVYSYIQPIGMSAEAQSVPGAIASTISCVVAGKIVGWLVKKFDTFLNIVKDFLNPAGYIKRSISAVAALIGGAGSVPTDDEKNNAKESWGDLIARCGAMAVLDYLTKGMISTIRSSGRDGGPSFVRNWRNFLTGSQYRGENIFRSILSQTNLCAHFDRSMKSLFSANTRQNLPSQNLRVSAFESFPLRNNCTLPSNFSLQSYIADFSRNGGWEALSRLTEPQNNFFGTFFSAMGEADTQRNFEQRNDELEITSGGGFTSRRGKDANDSCLVRGQNNSCLIYRDVITPGRTLADAASNVINQELAWITNTDEIEELMANLTNRLLRRILDLGGQRPASAVIGKPTNEEGPGIINDPNGSWPNAPGGGGGSPTVPIPSVPPGSVILCISIDYADGCEVFSVSSSIILPGDGTTATLCEHSYYGGQCTTFTVSDPDIDGPFLSSPQFPNDETSSVIVNSGPGTTPTPPPTGVIRLCDTIDFQGTCEDFNSDDPDLSNNTIGENTASSVVVPSGTSVIICSDPNYGGNCIQFTTSEPNFTILVNFNDVASSLRFLPVCSDGIDNEGDGFTDYPNDPECVDANGTDEGPPPPPPPQPTSLFGPECSDGLDNDNDGDTDFPDDTDCVDSFDDNEGLGIGM